MKFIAKHLNLIGLALLVAFGTATAVLYFGLPQKVHAAPAKSGEAKFTCPMHPQVVRDSAGDCPECGMQLRAPQSGQASSVAEAEQSCCKSKPATPVAAASCPHLANLTNAAPASAGCCPHE